MPLGEAVATGRASAASLTRPLRKGMAHGNEKQQAKPVRESCTEKDGEAWTPALPHEQSTKERDAPSDQTGQRRLKEHDHQDRPT